jgi:micrococcal nuclease
MRLLFCLGFLGCAAPGDEKQDSGADARSEMDSADGAQDTDDTEEPEPDFDTSLVPTGPNPCRGVVRGEVEKVTDGDTIKVATGRGVERVRLIGVDAPEVDHSGPDDDCFGEEAKAYTSAMLDGKTVWLGFDTECEDHFGRTLAYVHTGNVEDEGFFQRLLLKGGWTRTLRVAPNTAFSTTFDVDEAEAMANGNGLWESCR